MHIIVFIVYDGRVGIIYRVFIVCVFIISLPILLAIAVLVGIFSGFPIIFSQKRTGLNGIPFTMYKFRTMIIGAEKLQTKYKKLNIAGGPAFKIPDDPRFTKFGKILSHTGLDELPQLYNVLIGEMALFGPRPLPIPEAAKLNSWQKVRQKIKPGIISPWILNGYHKNTFENWMKSDIEYVKNKSLETDVQLFGRTVIYMARLIRSAV